jgi:MFS family permease
MIAFLIVFGIGWGGAVPMLNGLLREYFGRDSLGTIVGFAGSVMMVGVITGAPLAGLAFDRWEDYQPAWFLLAGIVGVATVLFSVCLKKNTSQ